MPRTTNESIAKALLAAAEIYEKNLSEQQIKLYCSMLCELEEVQLAQAMREHIAESEWWPKPADILKRAKKFEPEPEKLEEKPALYCCQNTQDLVNKYGGKYKREIKRV